MSLSSQIWPSLDDYQNAVRHPQRNLKDRRLHLTQVETRSFGALKMPFPRSGNFGAVYKFSNHHSTYALKVFSKAQPDRQLRYQLIHQHLATLSSPPNLVSFGYAEQGILVNGRWYPALVMDWAEGQLFDQHLADTLTRQGRVDNGRLCHSWVNLVQGLQQRSLAHGDLQHGNILVMPDGSFKLVDYDGMFVPAMRQAGLTASEIGLPAYQHPQRYRGYFDERLDNFAALVILLSLAGLDQDLWRRYHTDDNCLIVQEADLVRPTQSALLSELGQSSDAPVRKLAVILKAATQGNLEAIPPFADVIADNVIKQVIDPSWHPTGQHRPKPVQPPPPPLPQNQKAALTPREQEVLGLVVQEYRDEQIAHRLGLQPRTVSNYVSAIQRKAGVFTRRDLINWGLTQGYKPAVIAPIQPPPKPPPPKPPDNLGQQGLQTTAPTSNRGCLTCGGIAAMALVLFFILGGCSLCTGSSLLAQPNRQQTITADAWLTEVAATETASAWDSALTAQAQSESYSLTATAQYQATSIQDVWLESSGDYLVIHCRFQINRAQSTEAWVVAYFSFSDGSPIPAQTTDTTYSSPQGQAYVWNTADVIYEPFTYWEDFPLYMPYSLLPSGQDHYAVVHIQDQASSQSLALKPSAPFTIP